MNQDKHCLLLQSHELSNNDKLRFQTPKSSSRYESSESLSMVSSEAPERKFSDPLLKQEEQSQGE